MSKYNKLWEYVHNQNEETLKLTFDEIAQVSGVPIDHSFLNYKKELLEYGYKVDKISIKQQSVSFRKAE